MNDLGIESGLEGIELVALGLHQSGGGGDIVRFGSAIGCNSLIDDQRAMRVAA